MSHHYEISVSAITIGGVPILLARRKRPDKPGRGSIDDLLAVLADLAPCVEEDTDHYEIDVSAVTDSGQRQVLARRKRANKPGREAVEQLLYVLEEVSFVENHAGPSRPVMGPSKPEYVPETPLARLGYLVEECGEVLQIAGKSLRYGYASSNPELPWKDQVVNAVLLRWELDDLEAAIKMVRADIEGFPTHPDDVRDTGTDLLFEDTS